MKHENSEFSNLNPEIYSPNIHWHGTVCCWRSQFSLRDSNISRRWSSVQWNDMQISQSTEQHQWPRYLLLSLGSRPFWNSAAYAAQSHAKCSDWVVVPYWMLVFRFDWHRLRSVSIQTEMDIHCGSLRETRMKQQKMKWKKLFKTQFYRICFLFVIRMGKYAFVPTALFGVYCVFSICTRCDTHTNHYPALQTAYHIAHVIYECSRKWRKW